MAKKAYLSVLPLSTISDRMKTENPWWISGTINSTIDNLKRRKFFNPFISLVENISIKRAVVLMGPRRVGKSVLMQHAVKYLLNKDIERKKICFLSIDNPIYNNIGLYDLFKIARESVVDDNPDGWFVFFDEIQYLKNWETHLKSLVDEYPNTKFIVSGSAAAALKRASLESGAGRMTDFMLPPLTFYEYIYLKDLEHLMVKYPIEWKNIISEFYSTINHTELNNHFIDYINYGGYPEVIFSETIKANPSTFIRNDIIDKILLRDLPSLYGIQDVQELNSFFSMVAYNSGNELSLDVFSQSSGINKNLIKKYLEYLKAAFLIKKVTRINDNAKKYQRENFFKIYLTNPSLRAALFSPISQTDNLFGNMVETTIFSQWMQRFWFTPYYAALKKGEVDLVGINKATLKPQWALEIKWSNNYYDSPNKLKSLITFCKNNHLNSALVTTIDKEGMKELQDLKLYYQTAATYTYSIGKNTIDRYLE